MPARTWSLGSLVTLFAMGCGAGQSSSTVDDEEIFSSENAIVNVDHTDVERQSIGNCWIYAHGTWVESLNKSATGINFDVSQSYWTYWDWYTKLASGSSYDVSEKKEGDILTRSIETGGSWQQANNIVRRYGIVPEAEFVPEDATAEMSSRQKEALNAINLSLSSGALSTPEARRNKKLVRDELNKAWSLNASVVAWMNQVFGEDTSRDLSYGSSANVTGAPVISAKNFKAKYVSKSYSGRISTRNSVLSEAMNAWKQVSYPSNYSYGSSSSTGRRKFQISVQEAAHQKAPVIVTWSVDFNAMENNVSSPLAGSFNLTTLKNAGKPGRQGGHMTVLEDYQVKLTTGEVLKANVDVTDPAKLQAALDPSATIEFIQIKNSWGAARPDRVFAPGMPGYHNLNMDYLNGPIAWCTETEGLLPTEKRGCNTHVTPWKSVVLPPGFGSSYYY